MDRLLLATILGWAGFVGAVLAIGIGVWVAFRKPKLEEPLPDGVYRLHLLGRDKLTNAPMYEAEEIKEEEKK